jgi:hypothetical protein
VNHHDAPNVEEPVVHSLRKALPPPSVEIVIAELCNLGFQLVEMATRDGGTGRRSGLKIIRIKLYKYVSRVYSAT